MQRITVTRYENKALESFNEGSSDIALQHYQSSIEWRIALSEQRFTLKNDLKETIALVRALWWRAFQYSPENYHSSSVDFSKASELLSTLSREYNISNAYYLSHFLACDAVCLYKIGNYQYALERYDLIYKLLYKYNIPYCALKTGYDYGAVFFDHQEREHLNPTGISFGRACVKYKLNDLKGALADIDFAINYLFKQNNEDKIFAKVGLLYTDTLINPSKFCVINLDKAQERLAYFVIYFKRAQILFSLKNYRETIVTISEIEELYNNGSLQNLAWKEYDILDKQDSMRTHTRLAPKIDPVSCYFLKIKCHMQLDEFRTAHDYCMEAYKLCNEEQLIELNQLLSRINLKSSKRINKLTNDCLSTADFHIHVLERIYSKITCAKDLEYPVLVTLIALNYEQGNQEQYKDLIYNNLYEIAHKYMFNCLEEDIKPQVEYGNDYFPSRDQEVIVEKRSHSKEDHDIDSFLRLLNLCEKFDVIDKKQKRLLKSKAQRDENKVSHRFLKYSRQIQIQLTEIKQELEIARIHRDLNSKNIQILHKSLEELKAAIKKKAKFDMIFGAAKAIGVFGLSQLIDTLTNSINFYQLEQLGTCLLKIKEETLNKLASNAVEKLEEKAVELFLKPIDPDTSMEQWAKSRLDLINLEIAKVEDAVKVRVNTAITNSSAPSSFLSAPPKSLPTYPNGYHIEIQPGEAYNTTCNNVTTHHVIYAHWNKKIADNLIFNLRLHGQDENQSLSLIKGTDVPEGDMKSTWKQVINAQEGKIQMTRVCLFKSLYTNVLAWVLKLTDEQILYALKHYPQLMPKEAYSNLARSKQLSNML